MGIWAAAGTPRYEEDSAGIAYISNVGAYHQTLVRWSLHAHSARADRC